MRSSLWYKCRLLVLGSIMHTLKPLNSENNCFRVIPSTCAALKNRRGMGTVDKVLKRCHLFSPGFSLFNVYCTIFPRRFLWFCRHWSFSSVAISPVMLNSRTLSSSLQWYTFCLFVSKMWSFGTKLSESIRITNYFN